MSSQKSIDIIMERSGGNCEEPNCPGPDFRGLQRAHITHRKMGGRNGIQEKIIDDPRNSAILCAPAHDLLDGRVYNPEEAAKLSLYLKEKIGWEDWKQEHTA